MPSSRARSSNQAAISSAVVSPGMTWDPVNPSVSQRAVHSVRSVNSSRSSGVRRVRKSRIRSSADTRRSVYGLPIASNKTSWKATVSPSASGSVFEVLIPIRSGSRLWTTSLR